MVAPPTPTRIPLEEAVDLFLDTMAARASVGALSAATVRNYRQDLTELLRLVPGGTVTDDVTGADVDRVIHAYGATPDARVSRPGREAVGRSPSTQARFRRTLGTFFAHAERNAWVQASPLHWSSLQPRPRGGLRTARTALTLEQAEALLRFGPGDREAKGRSHERNFRRDRLALALMLVLGPRVSEVVAADDRDFSMVDGAEVWRVVGKGGKVRRLPLSPWLSQVKREYVESRVEGAGCAALLRTGRGNRLSPRDVQRMLERATARVRAVVPELAREATPHALRHTAATIMLSSGWDVKVVSQMLGHESIATTGVYLDEVPGELARAVAGTPLAVAPPTPGVATYNG